MLLCCTWARGTPRTRRTTPPASKTGSAPKSTHGGAPRGNQSGKREALEGHGQPSATQPFAVQGAAGQPGEHMEDVHASGLA